MGLEVEVNHFLWTTV